MPIVGRTTRKPDLTLSGNKNHHSFVPVVVSLSLPLSHHLLRNSVGQPRSQRGGIVVHGLHPKNTWDKSNDQKEDLTNCIQTAEHQSHLAFEASAASEVRKPSGALLCS